VNSYKTFGPRNREPHRAPIGAHHAALVETLTQRLTPEHIRKVGGGNVYRVFTHATAPSRMTPALLQQKSSRRGASCNPSCSSHRLSSMAEQQVWASEPAWEPDAADLLASVPDEYSVDFLRQVVSYPSPAAPASYSAGCRW
jgi:hypothetical protein